MDKKNKKLDKQTGYISLREATKYCPYSQEYLSLRARQGKLKAVKIGRNWVTTREWIQDYLLRFNNTEKGEINPVGLSEVSLNENLSEAYLREKPEEKVLKHLLFLGITIVILSVSLIFLIAFSRKDHRLHYNTLTGDITSKAILSSLTFSDLRRSLVENFKDYSNWIGKKISDVAVVLNEKLSYLSLRKLFKKETPRESVKISETAIQAQEKMGAVIFPYPLEAKAKEKIVNAFSDRVKIEPQDENSGIIVPVFKTKKEEKYFYIMVPLKEQ